MMRRFTVFLISITPFLAFGRQSPSDTTRKLQEVVVKAYFSEQPLLRSPASATVITAAELNNHSTESLLPALNTAPGVRMEERSPGSYRLSIRGSLLRSPFGIRNVKVYLDEIPFTDAGGNTYLNSLDAAAITGLTILKGAEGSIYGANTGGVLVIPQFDPVADSTAISVSLSGGSYGLLHQHIAAQKQWKNYQIGLKQAYQTSDGYRENSGLNRLYSQVNQQWEYAPNAQLRALILYSDLQYETPGGLTRTQAQQNPKLARQPTATLPGAVQQQAGIYNNTLLGGLINELNIAKNFRHVLAVSASYTDFKNPFITNYETRVENTAGLRSYIEYQHDQNGWNWKADLGIEAQRTASDIRNYENLAGEKGTNQSHDELQANQNFIFASWVADISKKLIIGASASYNFSNYRYQSNFPTPLPERTQQQPRQFMPRLAAAWQLTDDLGWRFSVSRGYSPPTIAEVRASDQVINTGLMPEAGWNYETGIRLNAKKGRFYFDANTFYFALKNAIVRRINQADAEYFVNAGGTRQYGIELQAIGQLITEQHNKTVNGLRLNTGYTYSHFTFSDYISGNADYSGNRLTGVPRHVLVTSLKLDLLNSVSIFGQHNFTSALPLNDANSDYADNYHLIQAKLTWKHKKMKNRYRLETFAGVDNLLNERYSLGNDLNAVGGRYFNPAGRTNFYAGITLNL